jgi:hypothetical protein
MKCKVTKALARIGFGEVLLKVLLKVLKVLLKVLKVLPEEIRAIGPLGH